jgi:hypothetical protein
MKSQSVFEADKSLRKPFRRKCSLYMFLFLLRFCAGHFTPALYFFYLDIFQKDASTLHCLEKEGVRNMHALARTRAHTHTHTHTHTNKGGRRRAKNFPLFLSWRWIFFRLYPISENNWRIWRSGWGVERLLGIEVGNGTQVFASIACLLSLLCRKESRSIGKCSAGDERVSRSESSFVSWGHILAPLHRLCLQTERRGSCTCGGALKTLVSVKPYIRLGPRYRQNI